MKRKEVTNFLYEQHNCVSDETCDRIIELFEELKEYHHVGKTTVAVENDHKRSTDLSVYLDGCECLRHEEFKNLMNTLVLNLGEGVKNYKEKYTVDNIGVDSIARWGIERGFNIQRYLPTEGYYGWHTENSGLECCPRILAWMIYLNNVTDGGGTEFFFQNKITKAERGKLLIWPSDWTHYHRGEISNTQIKYIATGWFRFLPDE
jgi:hypothetical protein